MKIFSADVPVWATMYVKAETADEARKLILASINAKSGTWIEVADAGGDIEISGARYDDPDLPDVSLSPAMTVRQPEADFPIEEGDDIPDPETETDEEAA